MTVGRSIAVARDSDGCSSRSARFAIHTSVGRSSQRQKSIVLRPVGIAAVLTHSGRCDGHCFS